MSAVPGPTRGPGALVDFEYVVLRVVPRVDRGEYLNGAVLLYCQRADYLDIRVRADLAALSSLAPDCDPPAIAGLLAGLASAVHGAGPAGALPLGPRFRWLAAPRSSAVQPGPIHTGLTTDPQAALERLVEQLL